jgi:bifunctional DNase/RNase
MPEACYVPGVPHALGPLALALAILACARSPSRERGEQQAERAPAPSVSATLVERPPSIAPSAFAGGARAAPRATPPPGFVVAEAVRAAPVGDGYAVLLVDSRTKRGVPLFVGGTEGLSIELRLAERRYPRPLTHDLLDSVLRELDARVHSARVEKLDGGVFFGVLVLQAQERTLELDARASDAVAMALGSGTPIFVSETVVARAGIPLDAIEDGGTAEPARPDIRL